MKRPLTDNLNSILDGVPIKICSCFGFPNFPLMPLMQWVHIFASNPNGFSGTVGQVQLLEGLASVEVSRLRANGASGQGGIRMDGSLQSLRCQDPSHEGPAALSCDAASGSVELALDQCHVTLSCPKVEVNTTEDFLLRCKTLGWTSFKPILGRGFDWICPSPVQQ